MAVDYEQCPACNGVGRSRDGDSVLGPSWSCGYPGCHERYGQFMVPVRVPDAAPARARSEGRNARPSGPPRMTVSAVIVSRMIKSRLARRTIAVIVATAAVLAAGVIWFPGYLGWAFLIGVVALSLARVPRAAWPLALAFVLGLITGTAFSVAVFMFGPPRWMRQMTTATPLIDSEPAAQNP